MGKKILLADDSITIQKVIELTFSDEDFDVVTVGNGRLALEKLAEVRPDIVLCDIIMPEKDGYEVCEQIKKSATFSHIPVLLLTGAFEPFDQERAARAGYDGSLAKPFEPETLIAKVKDLLARAPQRAAAAAAAGGPASLGPRPSFRRRSSCRRRRRLGRPRPVAVAPGGRGAGIHPGRAVRRRCARPAPPRPLAPMSDEESATLMAPCRPPRRAVEPAGRSRRVSTVMFKASDLPVEHAALKPAAPPTPTPCRRCAAARCAPAGRPRAGVRSGAGEHVEPEAIDAAEVIEEAAVFEEVVEEDLDFEPRTRPPPSTRATPPTRGRR